MALAESRSEYQRLQWVASDSLDLLFHILRAWLECILCEINRHLDYPECIAHTWICIQWFVTYRWTEIMGDIA